MPPAPETPGPAFGSTAAAAGAPVSPAEKLRTRVRAVSLRVVEAADTVLDALAPTDTPAPPPPHVARRLLANRLMLWHLCARATCRRSRCCRGEPRECLAYAAPLLPPDMLAALAGRRRGRKAARRRASGRPC